MRKEFTVERQGKTFVLYTGLLDIAHQSGLKSIHTDLVQIPNQSNNGVAICTATVILEKDGQDRIFTGIGDAAVNNVAPAMATCLIRMAETRAKARALRDAVNIGMAAFEELGEEDVAEARPAPRPARTRQATPPRPAPPAEQPTPIPAEMRNPAAHPITEAQSEAIRKLCQRRGVEVATVAHEQAGVSFANLTQAQASDLIKSLNAAGK